MTLPPNTLPFSNVLLYSNTYRRVNAIGPRGREAVRGELQVSSRINPSPSPYSEVHLNILSPLSEVEIFAIARREGWTALSCDRGGFFKLIEFWLENSFMLEIMNNHEWERYRKWDRAAATPR